MNMDINLLSIYFAYPHYTHFDFCPAELQILIYSIISPSDKNKNICFIPF